MKPKPFDLNAERAAQLAGEVSHASLIDIMPVIAKLDQEVHKDGILLYITSPGGLATVGLAIYDLLRTRRNKVTVIGLGECSSAAVLILQAGHRRLLMPHTRLLLHFGQTDLSGRGSLTAEHLDAGAKEMARLNDTYLNILCARLKQPSDRWLIRRMLERETYITAQQAVEIGFADDIIYKP